MLWLPDPGAPRAPRRPLLLAPRDGGLQVHRWSSRTGLWGSGKALPVQPQLFPNLSAQMTKGSLVKGTWRRHPAPPPFPRRIAAVPSGPTPAGPPHGVPDPGPPRARPPLLLLPAAATRAAGRAGAGRRADNRGRLRAASGRGRAGPGPPLLTPVCARGAGGRQRRRSLSARGADRSRDEVSEAEAVTGAGRRAEGQPGSTLPSDAAGGTPGSCP